MRWLGQHERVSGSSRDTAVRAAVDIGAAAGYCDVQPVVVQETNNVVVWLAPHQVIAKVGVWPHSADVLAREVEVCAQLAALGAPCAAPIGALTVDSASGLPVSLWVRLEAVAGARPAPEDLARTLRRVHVALRSCDVELPSFFVAIDHARAALSDDNQMAALSRRDLVLLREAFDEWARAVRDWPTSEQPLHGEPHLGNVIATAGGLHFVDFEAVSLGPMEWDLASMDAEVSDAFDDVDRDLLDLLRLLNSARIATWGLAGAQHPSMRAIGEHHLEIVRRAPRS